MTHIRDYPLRRILAGVAFAIAMSAITSAFGAQSSAPPPAAHPVASIQSALASTDRFPGDSDEDVWRKPQPILEFMGLKPGMQILDYFAASGYYSEILARSVGSSGKVIAYNNPEYAEFAGDKLTKRFASKRLPNVQVLTVPTDKLELKANSLDGVLFVMSYHDLYWRPKDAKAQLGNPAQVTSGLFQMVKPGGVVVVVDHVAMAGGETAKVVDALHRIDPQVVKSDFSKSGFVFDGESAVLRNAGDDHTKLVFDDSVRHKTDQFVYRFRKPAQK